MQNGVIVGDRVAVLVRDLVHQRQVEAVAGVGDGHDVARQLGDRVGVVRLSHGAADRVVGQHMGAGLGNFDARLRI